MANHCLRRQGGQFEWRFGCRLGSRFGLLGAAVQLDGDGLRRKPGWPHRGICPQEKHQQVGGRGNPQRGREDYAAIRLHDERCFAAASYRRGQQGGQLLDLHHLASQ